MLHSLFSICCCPFYFSQYDCGNLFVVALIYISLIYHQSETLFMDLLAICIPFSVKCLFMASDHFLINV